MFGEMEGLMFILKLRSLRKLFSKDLSSNNRETDGKLLA